MTKLLPLKVRVVEVPAPKATVPSRAVSVPWSKAANDDGTFRNADELRALYQDAGVKFDRPMVTYCRIGERSSHTWFVLRYLLGVEDVRNYDGSWTEWGNLIEAPIAKGA